LTKSGAGTLRLDANNSGFFGTFAVSGGTLEIGNVNNLGHATLLGLDGGTLLYTGVGTQSLTGETIDIGAGGGTFDIAEASATLNLFNSVTGTGTLSKTGAGSLTLGAVNSRTGATNILEGTLIVSGGSALDNLGRVTVSSGAAFNLLDDETIG